MIGSDLTRFWPGRFCVWDTESEGLNLAFHRPWEISYAICTLKGGIQSFHTSLIRWPDLDITEDAARITRFDRARYEAEARPAREVWDEFAPVLYDPEIRSVGHNTIGFDYAMINTWSRALGLPPDHSWAFRAYDTHCLAKGYKKGFEPDISSPLAFAAYQYRCQAWIEKGLKTSLGTMCGELGLEYDESRAHGAAYDCDRQWAVFRELVFKLNV